MNSISRIETWGCDLSQKSAEMTDVSHRGAISRRLKSESWSGEVAENNSWIILALSENRLVTIHSNHSIDESFSTFFFWARVLIFRGFFMAQRHSTNPKPQTSCSPRDDPPWRNWVEGRPQAMLHDITGRNQFFFKISEHHSKGHCWWGLLGIHPLLVAAPHRWLKKRPAKWLNVSQGKHRVDLILLNGMWIDETHNHLSIFVSSASGFWTLAPGTPSRLWRLHTVFVCLA